MSNYSGFTWKHYAELFADTRMIQIVLDTLLVALLSSLIATIIGALGALAIDRTSRPVVKNTVLSLNNILMVSPDVIIGASFLIFYTALKVPLGFWSVLMSHIAFSIPIVVLMILPRLQEMSHSLLDAARDLGASNYQVLTRVIVPYITPGIFSGFFMAFTFGDQCVVRRYVYLCFTAGSRLLLHSTSRSKSASQTKTQARKRGVDQ